MVGVMVIVAIVFLVVVFFVVIVFVLAMNGQRWMSQQNRVEQKAQRADQAPGLWPRIRPQRYGRRFVLILVIFGQVGIMIEGMR